MWKAGIKWMFLIIGTMIGAGYASGRELWQFFGYESGLAILLFTVLFFTCTFVIMTISQNHGSEHYLPILEQLMGKKLTKLYDGMIILYLFSTTVIMMAGGGATLEVLHVSYWYGVMILAFLLVLLFIWGINGMTSINALIIPLLIFFLVTTLLVFQKSVGWDMGFEWTKQANWPSAFTFTALNILPLIAVLGAIGSKIKHRGEIWIASIGSASTLGVISYLYNQSLIQVAQEVMIYEIPLFAILKNYPYFMVLVMSGLLWAAIFTTAASGMLGLCTRLQPLIKIPFWALALVLSILMMPLTTFGFSKLVGILYPLYGLLNLYILASIMLYPIIHKFDNT
ncbi:hypothetical protein CR203_17160 [Salipaludibacillus neizhouensis]|uniref:Transporter n=1 Tax=Salipaludibacillus neizhouensis TaxID=885475 RepID=A0A3A9K3Y4_9BACI|nr:hypothetical protein [Salipaludibacillus neizhouensis]RKL66028.1 hypothetical protein CR203_17160 [Salipaludibacillus neizhouensis]